MGTRFKTLFQKIIIIIFILKGGLLPLPAYSCLDESHFKLVPNKYAKGFAIYKNKSMYLVKTNKQKILITRNEKIYCKDYVMVNAPINKIIATSTTHLAALEMLNEHHTLIGFPDIKLITTPQIIELVEQKKIVDLEYPFNLEKIFKLRPEMIMGYSSGVWDDENLANLKKINQRIVLNDDFNEDSLLARAEWIKFIAVFYNKLDVAYKIFDDIEKNYLEIKKMVKDLKKIKVLVGQNINGIWSAPGGASDLAQLISDAGGEYVWQHKKERNTLQMSLESVWSDLNQCDIWLTQNTWFNMKDMIDSDNKYSKLKVVQSGRVYNHVLKLNQWKNMNYWETGVMRPDLLIRDLVIIFHPSVLKDEKTNWYDRLK